jgi:hypothetical protein
MDGRVIEIDQYRREGEPESLWRIKKEVILRNKYDLSLEQRVSIAQAYVNVKLYRCK